MTWIPEELAAAGTDGLCVVEGITLKQFHRKCDANDGAGCFRMEFKKDENNETGKAWIYEIPNAIHDGAAGEVMDELAAGLGGHRKDFVKAASPRCDSNNNDSFEPDGLMNDVQVRDRHAQRQDMPVLRTRKETGGPTSLWRLL